MQKPPINTASHNNAPSEVIGRTILGVFVGGIVGLLAGPIIGFVCGLLEAVVITRILPINAYSSSEDSITMLAFLVAYTMLICGPVIGGLTGIIAAAINRPFSGLLVATSIGIGCGCGVLLAGITSRTFDGFVTYALPSIVTCLISAQRVEVSLKPMIRKA